MKVEITSYLEANSTSSCTSFSNIPTPNEGNLIISLSIASLSQLFTPKKPIL